MATIKDIAKLVGVSVSAVSMALNDSPEIGDKTKEKVRKAAEKLNYVKSGVAIDLQRQKTNIVLFITDNPTRPYFTDSLHAVQNELNKKRIDLIIITANHNNLDTAERFISEKRVDAVICMSKFISDEFVNKYANKNMPIFVLGRNLDFPASEYLINVSLDYDRVGEEITEYLIKAGHQKVAFVKGSKTSIGSIYRYEGYLRTLNKHNIPINEEIIFEAHGSEYDHGYEITEQIIKKISSNQIEAIFYTNDDLAVGGLQKLLEHEITVPEDVSIVGYNNYPISRMITPKLTTVDLHQQKIMTRVTEVLIEIFKGNRSSVADSIKDLQQDSLLYSEIIERDSVKIRSQKG